MLCFQSPRSQRAGRAAHENSTCSAQHSVLRLSPIAVRKTTQRSSILNSGRFISKAGQFSQLVLHVSAVPAPSMKEKLHVPSAICPTPKEYQNVGRTNHVSSTKRKCSWGWREVLPTPGPRQGKQAAGSAWSKAPGTAAVSHCPLPDGAGCTAYSSLRYAAQACPAHSNAVHHHK